MVVSNRRRNLMARRLEADEDDARTDASASMVCAIDSKFKAGVPCPHVLVRGLFL